MKSLLYEIYNGDYDTTPALDETQRQLMKQLCAEWEKIHTMFGDEFAERVFTLEGELEDRRSFHYYHAGFQCGVRLMLEALTPHPGSTAPG